MNPLYEVLSEYVPDQDDKEELIRKALTRFKESDEELLYKFMTCNRVERDRLIRKFKKAQRYFT